VGYCGYRPRTGAAGPYYIKSACVNRLRILRVVYSRSRKFDSKGPEQRSGPRFGAWARRGVTGRVGSRRIVTLAVPDAVDAAFDRRQVERGDASRVPS